MSENVKNSGEILVDAKQTDESENNKNSEINVVKNDASDDEKEKDSKTTTNESKSKSENDDANNSDKKHNKSSESAKGIALGAIPQIEKYINSTRIEGLQTLHQICFKAIGKTNVLKKNLRQFSGFEFDETSDEFEDRMESAQKMELAKLKAVCEGLKLDKKGTKDVICQRICKFLIAPQKTDTASDEEASDSEEGEEEEEEESEPEPEPEPVRRTKSSSRGNAGRPRRSTAGRGKDTSTYVEYSSSSDEDEKSNRSKSNKRKKDDSDSGSDYNPEPDSAESDTGKKGTRFSTRGQPGSRRSARNRRSTTEEEETPTSDEDFSDEPKKRKVTPRGPPKVHGRTRGRGRGRKVKDTESEEDQSESESDQSEETPKRKTSTKNDVSNRKTTPRSKRAAASAKPIRDESSGENESEDDEPLSKKAKPSPPTDEEIKKIVKDILDKANLEEITMKTVCRHVYSKYPDFDLSHKKEFIKTTVKSLIST